MHGLAFGAEQVAAKATEAAVDAARAAYAPAGDFAALLFFCISDLVSLDPMYQYSLPWWVPGGAHCGFGAPHFWPGARLKSLVANC